MALASLPRAHTHTHKLTSFSFPYQTPQKQIQKQNEDEILRKVVELEEEKRKLQGKLKQVERKNDHYQRALRLAEIPKLQADWEKRRANDLVYAEEQYVCLSLTHSLFV